MKKRASCARTGVDTERPVPVKIHIPTSYFSSLSTVSCKACDRLPEIFIPYYIALRFFVPPRYFQRISQQSRTNTHPQPIHALLILSDSRARLRLPVDNAAEECLRPFDLFLVPRGRPRVFGGSR